MFLDNKPPTIESLPAHVNRDGWGLVPDLFSQPECDSIIYGCDRAMSDGAGVALTTRGKTFGARNLLDHWDGWRAILRNGILQRVLNSIVGPECGLVRMLWFDKPPGAGWALPWHRDQTIAVKNHPDDPQPFSRPTTKSGVPHLVAPDSLLQTMLTVRLHLDPMMIENGPLQVITGSHLIAAESDVGVLAEQGNIETILTGAGTAFLMRPLLLHGSLPSDPNTTMHRRILHMEFAANVELPGDVQWRDFIPVSGDGAEVRNGKVKV